MNERWRFITEEFAHHFPFTLVGSLIAMAGAWWFGSQFLNHGPEADFFLRSRALFHLFHPLHICLSAIATTSLFWRHERRLWRTILVGSLGTILPCGLSDYVFPYLGGQILGQTMQLHVCLVEHPQLFLSFLVLGMIGGFLAEERLTGSHLFSHGAHIFVSSAASLLYLMSFGFTGWMSDVRMVVPAFVTVVLAVWIPCCISDIVVPASTVKLPADHVHAS
jgi:hypothetical protein